MCPDTTRTATTTCVYPQCPKPVWRDPDGSYSLFCGKTHRDGMTAKLSPQSESVCKQCQSRPIYIANGRAHEFCGLRCAQAYSNGQQHPAKTTDTERIVACAIAGCNNPVFTDRFGHPSSYCSQAHRLIAVRDGSAEACMFCTRYPKALVDDNLSDYCSKTCAQDTTDAAPLILALSSRYKAYENVSEQFTTQWMHPTKVPDIMRIWKIYSSKSHNDEFSRYRLSIERRTGQDGGNSRRRWHGTVRACRLGDEDDQTAFCNDKACSLCSILQSSFEKTMAGARTNFGRFGAGIYTTGTSSKANDYIGERGGSPYKVMLLNEVIMGKTIKLTTSNPGLTEAPEGFDSVVGEPGNVLNYDESIVYKNEAIRPLYLIIFQP